jgi:Immunity protein 8
MALQKKKSVISEVKSLMSTEVYDLENYRPEDCQSFSFTVTVTVGIQGRDGGDMFGIVICTPKWLLENHSKEDILVGRHKLIVFQCDMPRILRRIRKLFDHCVGDNWAEIAAKLSRVGHWEFEDYQTYK